ncbi:MAG: cobalamin biosynthesis protein CbiD [Verrucomicrobia bacterium]|nr:cobalamin biosynthesis protein CbiD [Verrucomicrobiota bacterium]MBV9673849.1 cobalamin biosynthesis protein CbiD [Verrucomicrobiota bacterium]
MNIDLSRLAENGLRRGYTTGACATAAVKAGLLRLLCGENPSSVQISLPGGQHYLTVDIDRIESETVDCARAEVIKDAGDDPDQTHRARIFARVSRNRLGLIRFFRGEGVGTVTRSGLQIPIGAPAINPVPRSMMIAAVKEVLDERDFEYAGFDLQIGCENGEAIAKRTFNPRLGVVGGISILGTTGIVEPKSTAAFQASIAVYVRVALGGHPSQIVLTPGNLGQRFARETISLPLECVVQMSNFVGFALECVKETLVSNNQDLGRLWLVGHPGKLGKLLNGEWDTHSGSSRTAVVALCNAGVEFGLDRRVLDSLSLCSTVEGMIEFLQQMTIANTFWSFAELQIAKLIALRLSRVEEIRVRLFKMNGTPLGHQR